MPSRKILKLEISLLAKDDLRDIAQYTFTHFGERQVDIYLNALYSGMELLTHNPEIGYQRRDIPAGYQCFIIEKHLLIYTVKNQNLIIARILHQSRDIQRHL